MKYTEFINDIKKVNQPRKHTLKDLQVYMMRINIYAKINGIIYLDL